MSHRDFSSGTFNFTIFCSINNKLQNPEAAHGVLVYAMNNAKIDLVCDLLTAFRYVCALFPSRFYWTSKKPDKSHCAPHNVNVSIFLKMKLLLELIISFSRVFVYNIEKADFLVCSGFLVG